MSNFMGRRPPEVEGRCDGSRAAEGGVQNDDAVGLRAAGELRVAEQAAPEGTNPNVQVSVSRLRRNSPRGCGFHAVIITTTNVRALQSLAWT
jgi:hypothetical protein